jgi:hypothetical protein
MFVVIPRIAWKFETPPPIWLEFVPSTLSSVSSTLFQPWIEQAVRRPLIFTVKCGCLKAEEGSLRSGVRTSLGPIGSMVLLSTPLKMALTFLQRHTFSPKQDPYILTETYFSLKQDPYILTETYFSFKQEGPLYSYGDIIFLKTGRTLTFLRRHTSSPTIQLAMQLNTLC